MSEKIHYNYIDRLRILALFCVIVLHEAGGTMYRTFGLDWDFLNIIDSFVYCGVPLFFMISGFLLLSGDRTADFSILIKKRLPKLVIPLIAWSLVASAWIGHLADDYSINGLVTRFIPFIKGPIMVHFWYMYTIIAIYIISPVLYCGIKNISRPTHVFIVSLIISINLIKILFIFLPASYSSFLDIDLFNQLFFFDGNLLVFILGYYLGNTKKEIPSFLLLLIACLLIITITIGSKDEFRATGSHETIFRSQNCGLEVFLASTIFLLFKQNMNRPSFFIKKTGVVPLSLGIYLMHVISMELLFGLGFTPYSSVQVLLYSFLNFLFCFIVLMFVSSIKPLCFLATGIKYSEACKSCNLIHLRRQVLLTQKRLSER